MSLRSFKYSVARKFIESLSWFAGKAMKVRDKNLPPKAEERLQAVHLYDNIPMLHKGECLEAVMEIGKSCSHIGGIPTTVPDPLKEPMEKIRPLFAEVSKEDSDIIIFCVLAHMCDIGFKSHDEDSGFAFDFSDIARFLSCNTSVLFSKVSVFDAYNDCGFLLSNERVLSPQYTVIPSAIISLGKGEAPRNPLRCETTQQFLITAVHSGRSIEASFHIMPAPDVSARHKQLIKVIKFNQHLSVVQTLIHWFPEILNLESTSHDRSNVMVLVKCCVEYLHENTTEVQFNKGSLDNYVTDGYWMKFRHGNTGVFTQGLVEFVKEGSAVRSWNENDLKFTLTDKAKNGLIGDELANLGDKPVKFLTRHDSFAEKTMFYSKKNQENVDELTTLLGDMNYKAICDRLESKGQRKGFCCLFYGAPGTGKTETVYQIARSTERDVMKVDLSQTRDMWYGNTEKNVRKIFSDYAYAVKHTKKTPILLFNEADALLGRRMENKSSTVDSTENAIQNILLQCMEDLEGIMVATTNLEKNLDTAFERRFIYKICFDKPSLDARVGIWKTLVPDLAESLIRDVAGRFEMTGGQIENISRKMAVNYVLHGEETFSGEKLLELCEMELGKAGRIMGFGK